MGLLSWLGTACKAVTKFIPFVDIARRAWSAITGRDERQNELASRKGVNPEKSAASEIAELHKLLAEYRQGIVSAGDELEREMIVECSFEMKAIMDLFDEVNKELKIVRSASIKRKFKHLNGELKGTFSKYIEKEISLDNPECIKILKLPSGELKNQRLQEMKQRVFLAAKNEMIDKIKYTVSDFSDTVEDAIMEHIDRISETIEDKKNVFEKISMSAEKDTDEIDGVLIHANYILSVCSYAEGL